MHRHAKGHLLWRTHTLTLTHTHPHIRARTHPHTNVEKETPENSADESSSTSTQSRPVETGKPSASGHNAKAASLLHNIGSSNPCSPHNVCLPKRNSGTAGKTAEPGPVLQLMEVGQQHKENRAQIGVVQAVEEEEHRHQHQRSAAECPLKL